MAGESRGGVAAAPATSNRVLWRLVSGVSGLFAVLAFFTSQAWAPMPQDTADDPANSATLAASVLATSQVTGIAGHSMTLLRDWLPETELLTRQGALAVDLRRVSVDQAWQRLWVDPGTRESVSVVVILFRSHDLKHESPALCRPISDWDVAGTAVSGPTGEDAWYGAGCLRADVGRLAIWVSASSVGSGSMERARTLLAATLAAQLARVHDSPDNPVKMRMTVTRTAMQRGYLFALVGISLLVVSRGTIADRSTWQALGARRRAGRLPRGAVDITEAGRHRRSQVHAVGMFRFAMLMWALRLTEVLPMDTVSSVATLIAAFLLGVLAQRVVLERTFRTRRFTELTWFGRLVLVAGLLVSLAVVGTAGFLWLFGNSSGSLGVFPGVPDWYLARLGVITQWLAAWVLLVAIAPVSLARRLAMRSATPRSLDRHGAVLLLRNFSDDYLELRVRQVGRAGLIDQLLLRRRSRFEEIEAFSLAGNGGVLAVGRPGERLPPGLGATRLHFGSDWQPRIEELMGSVGMIVLNLGLSESLVWETRRLVELGLLHKTVFVMPPVPAGEQRNRLALLAEALQLPWHLLEPGLSTRNVLAVAVPLFGREPVLAMAATQDDVSYDIALRVCRAALEDGSIGPDFGLVAPAPIGAVALAPGDVGPAPQVSVLAPRKSTRRRKIWQGPWFWVGVVQALLVPFVIPWMGGDPSGSDHARKTVFFPDEIAVSHVLGGSAAASMVVLNGTSVARVDFSSDDPTTTLVGSLPRGVTGASLADGVVYWVAPQSPDTTGQAGAWSVAESREIWTRDLPAGSHALAVGSRSVFITSAVSDSVTSFDRQTGVNRASAHLPCQPWRPRIVGEELWIACPAEDFAPTLDPETLAIARRATVPRGVVDVVTLGNATLVGSLTERKLSDPQDPSTAFYFSTADPVMASNGATLAVEGYERVSIFRDGTVDRRLLQSGLTSVGVLASGDVVAGAGSTLIFVPNAQAR